MVAAGGEINRALGITILDERQRDDLIASEVPRLNCRDEIPLSEYLRLAKLDVVRLRISFFVRPLERRPLRLRPRLPAIDRRTFRRIVLANRTADDLAHEPVGIQVRRDENKDVLAHSF